MTLSWIIVVTAVFKPLLVWSKTNIFIFISLRRIYNVPNDLLQTLCCHILYCNHQHYFSDVYVLYSCLSSETFTPSHWITGGLLVFWSNKQCWSRHCVLLASCELGMGIYFQSMKTVTQKCAKRLLTASMVKNSMMDCVFSRYIYPANGS